MTFIDECRRMTLRLRPDVYEVVKRSASKNFRSITAEINELLLNAIKKAPEPTDQSVSDAPKQSVKETNQ
ncbi:hypothetical protein [Saccharibacter floricola]|uniref:Arc-like DNA binding domain-containing protein n=1 Tax=Saccharibacter floricola DSM 15669 TaxID=1123227 RepID=A0ABQ0NZB7_9PROT|nr:hypothetical protein [Saccharibacter floricola]GBQ07260.1 hypothetical protein AA15669_1302 [Saccharibacter floricola DSM 15669]